jgi:hypothetical protein
MAARNINISMSLEKENVQEKNVQESNDCYTKKLRAMREEKKA